MKGFSLRNLQYKFPMNYIIELSKNEWEEVKSKFSTSPPKRDKVKIKQIN